MTFSLRRKRPTTVPARNTPSRTAFSLAIVLGLATLGQSEAQQPLTSFPSLTPPPPIKQVQQLDTQPRPPMVPSTSPARDQGFVQGMGRTDPKYGTANTNEDLLDYNIRLDPPGAELLFGRLDSESSLMERMRQENKNRPQAEKVMFPEKPVLTNQPYMARTFPAQAIFTEPNYVGYHRLYTEDKNVERYGWELGILQPIASAAGFYKDVFFLPAKIASYPHRRYDTSAGQCLPGDPIPYLLYPPEITWQGGLVQIGTLVGLYGVIP